MTDKQGGGMAALNKADGGRRAARMKDVGNIADGLKIQLGIRPLGRGEQIARHEKVGRKVVGNAFRRHLVLRTGFLDPADECLAFVMGPVADLVRKRKSLTPIGTILAYRDDGGVVATDYPHLASLKFAKADAGAKMKCYSLKIDLLRLDDP